MYKKIKQFIPAFNINMGGLIIKQALPTNDLFQVDPFLLLHHGKLSFKNHSPAIQQGIGPHPHRGFTPVTFVIDGEVHHRDSRGNNQIAKKGEVQWMHAGAGIVHSERPSQKLVEKEGSQEIIQLWINSPANNKMLQPKYQYTPETEMTTFLSNDQKIENKLVAGNYQGLKGKIEGESELLVIWSKAKSDAHQTFKISKEFNTMIYVIEGGLEVPNQGEFKRKTLIIFDNNAEEIEISIKENTQFLLLAGIPLNEKVTQQGPFVMNTTTEIMEAMRDYQMGKMGVLIEDN